MPLQIMARKTRSIGDNGHIENPFLDGLRMRDDPCERKYAALRTAKLFKIEHLGRVRGSNLKATAD